MGIGLKDINALRSAVKAMDAREFVGYYPSPVIVGRRIMGGQLVRDSAPRIRPSEIGAARGRKPLQKKQTLLHVTPANIIGDVTDPRMLVNRPMPRELYAALQKREVNPRLSSIAIGRTAVNDVMINDYTVSANHALFIIEPARRRYFLNDLGSKNGTWIGDDRMESGKRVPIKSGWWVGFGRVTFEFFDPYDFFSYLVDHRPNESESLEAEELAFALGTDDLKL